MAPEHLREAGEPQDPRLTAVVVHWHDEARLAELVAAWPRTPATELLVVDNGSSVVELASPARLLRPGRNLGFAGGVNLGTRAARAPLVLILNPDARPRPGAIERLVDAFEKHPEAAGVVPALEGPAGEPQCRWQLQPLPGPGRLLLQAFFLAGARGPRREPPAGSAVEQPAAAALALRRRALEAVGGLDEGFHPAWFEDVDLARRLADAGERLVYEPGARFVHAGGGSLERLGYGPFLWVYYRNLGRYLGLHHGGGWAAAARLATAAGMLLRLFALPLRRPRRATSRREAAAALAATGLGALSGWRRPRRLALRFTPASEPSP